jgi:multidrug efflux pump subunit AcrA (membrane-fusion protein)
MTLSKTRKRILLSAILLVLLLITTWISGRKQAAGIYKVKKENFEAIISCKGEIQSEKAVLINLPDIFGNRTLELWDMQIKDLVPEGSIVKKGDYVALLDQGRIKQLKENNEEVLKRILFNYNDAKIDSAVDLVALRNAIDQFAFDLKNKKIEMEQAVYESPAYQRKAQMAYERTSRQMDAKVRAYLMTQKTLQIQVSREEARVKELTLKDQNYQIAFEAARITARNAHLWSYIR